MDQLTNTIFPIHLIIPQTIAMLLTALLLPGLKVSGLFGALVTVIALAFVNTYLWDAALFLQVPNTLTSQAITLFIANGFIFFVMVKLLPGIEMTGILSAFIAPVIFSITTMLITNYGEKIPWKSIANSTVNTVFNIRDSLKNDGSITNKTVMAKK